nr:hypothetical protein [Tanacetum cinerariifolium]
MRSTLSPLPTTETSNIPPSIPDFASIFKVNDKVLVLEKAVAKLKNDPLHTQVTALVDDYLDTKMGATREEFMNFLSASLTDKITKQVRNQLPLILLEEVSNFASPVIEKMIQESLNQVNLAKASSQPQSTYEAATTLIEFELKKQLIDKMNSSESYLTALEHRECYDGLVKSYNLDNDFFSSYDVYSLKRSRDDKDKDEGPSAGSDKGLKKRKTSKDAKPTTSLKTKDSSQGLQKVPNLNQNLLGSLFMRRNQSSRLEIPIRLKVKKEIMVMIRLNPVQSLLRDVTGSQNLHILKNPLIPTGMKTGPLRQEQLKTG